jgi:hypothetical protein
MGCKLSCRWKRKIATRQIQPDSSFSLLNYENQRGRRDWWWTQSLRKGKLHLKEVQYNMFRRKEYLERGGPMHIIGIYADGYEHQQLDETTLSRIWNIFSEHQWFPRKKRRLSFCTLHGYTIIYLRRFLWLLYFSKHTRLNHTIKCIFLLI